MECQHIADTAKERLAGLHHTFGPFDLKQRIEAKLRGIFSLVTVASCEAPYMTLGVLSEAMQSVEQKTPPPILIASTVGFPANMLNRGA